MRCDSMRVRNSHWRFANRDLPKVRGTVGCRFGGVSATSGLSRTVRGRQALIGDLLWVFNSCCGAKEHTWTLFCVMFRRAPGGNHAHAVRLQFSLNRLQIWKHCPEFGSSGVSRVLSSTAVSSTAVRRYGQILPCDAGGRHSMKAATRELWATSCTG